MRVLSLDELARVSGGNWLVVTTAVAVYAAAWNEVEAAGEKIGQAIYPATH